MMAIADDGSMITDLSWEYLNFIRVGNKILMAQLGKPSDRPALNRIQEAFPNCEVYPIKHAQTLTRLGVGLRAVLEHDLKRRLDNKEWGAFNEAFSVYWNNLFDSDGLFSPDDMFHSTSNIFEV